MYNRKLTRLWIRRTMLMLMALATLIDPTYSQKAAPKAAQGEPHDTLRTIKIEEAVIIGAKQKFSVVSPMPVQILSGAALEKLNSLSVADAIRYFSGVQLKDYGGIGGIKTINVRSLGSAHTAVFYDGMSIGNAQNGQVDLGKYSLDNIQAIELYNGQKSSIFQPARGLFSSNTLFLRSKIPQFSPDKSYNLKATFKTGSFGMVNPAVLYQQKLSSQLSLTTSVEWVKAHGRYKYRYLKTGGYDTTATRQNGDVASLRSEIMLNAKVFEAGQATLKAYYYDSERGLPGAIVANRYSHVQRQWDRNFFIHGSLQNSLFEGHDLLLNVKYSRDYSRYVDPDYKTINGALDNRYTQNELYASAVNQYAISKWWSVSLAADVSINTLDANLYRFPYPTRYTYLGAFSNQMKWERLDIQASFLGGYVDETVKEYQTGESRAVFCPVVSASYQPFESRSFRVRAFYKESFRMPTFNDLYYTFVGNSSLKPEFTTQYDIGATWIYDTNSGFVRSASVQVDGYYNRIKDKIVAMPSSNLFRWTMMNLGLVDIRGFEANANIGLRLTKKLSADLGVSYTYQRAIDKTPDGATDGQQIAYTPIHSGTVTSSVSWGGWQLNYSFVYTGERYSQKANIPINYVQPWYTHDMAVVWDGRLLKHRVRVGLEVNNLLNQYYDVILNFPMPGRNYRLNFSVNF